jgi:hypothetical protein
MVYISLQGNVEGKTLNYYITLEECYADALQAEIKAKPGVGYVCIEDTPNLGERL